ncbi:peptidylprolyl isomerase [Luteolibacter pohnpeiensis]|uniref:Peptidyl-prolyl cis-trans isomerase n=2 Tax=Luteolibacter pohnpeiensis TaxID=454153 RepID=A0A934S4L9_9BACT|nr:peptidylprolyl isomerase [Luteolibacter pohnpeiensis]
MKTNMGDIEIQLDGKNAPISTANFLKYVEKKQYDGTVFHRVIENFMIQGGGYIIKDGRFAEKATDAPIKNESNNGLKNERGTIAMARTSDPNSATSQFFINVKDNPSLNYPNNGGGYAVFGKVTKGMNVVDKIREVETGSFPPFPTDAPQKPVIIESVTVIK